MIWWSMICKYEPIRAKKGQVVADFIVDHNIKMEDNVCMAEAESWTLFLDGSVCSQGRGIRCLIISPHGMEYEFSTWLEFECTNNQAEYEALLCGVEMIVETGAKSVKIFGDSKLVVQQVSGESQCLDGVLNEYKEKCLEILNGLDQFSITHIPLEDNSKANMLAQQALGYKVKRGTFGSKREPMSSTVLAIQEDGGTSTDRNVLGENDWRRPLTEYINNPSSNQNWTMEGLLLKCLGEEEVKIAMGEVHEGMCGAHQSAHKMRWTL
jgi:ribonuclease HI